MNFRIRTVLILITLIGIGLFAKGRYDQIEYRRLAGIWIEKEQESIQSLFGTENTVSIFNQVAPFEFNRPDIPPQFDVHKPETIQWKQVTQDLDLIENRPARKEAFCHHAIYADDRTDRMCAIRLLVDQFPKSCSRELRRIAFECEDELTAAAAIHCLGVQRKKENIPYLKKLLKEPKVVSQAALDALAFTYSPDDVIDSHFLVLPTLPVIPLARTASPDILHPGIFQNFITPQYRQTAREKIKRFLPDQDFYSRLQSPDTIERRVVALACVHQPPANYRLRFAEWGVWVNHQGNLKLVESIVDEIPDFVHRKYLHPDIFDMDYAPITITKPVLHLTSDKWMSVRIASYIRYGLPSFSYPKPDVFCATTHSNSSRNSSVHDWFAKEWIGSTEMLALSKHQSSYRWLVHFPDSRTQSVDWIERQLTLLLKHRGGDSSASSPWNLRRGPAPNPYQLWLSYNANLMISSIGVRWNALIVSPEKPEWAKLEEVPANQQWWSRLREVESSWVTSGNETERFVYYDGPTALAAGFTAKLKSDSELEIKATTEPLNFPPKQDPVSAKSFFTGTMPGKLFEKVSAEKPSPAMYVEVEGSSFKAILIDRFKPGLIDLSEEKSLTIEEAKAELRSMIIQAGLNESEAEGMLDAWHTGFFVDPGKRLISFLDRREYDNYCPVEIQPQPTEMARVGLLLTPLDLKRELD